MTFTDVLPSLRRTIPDPLRRDSWPEFTAATITDVTVCGLSMLRLVEWCETPCVHTAAAVIPGTGRRPSPTDLASVLMTRVEAITRSPSGQFEVWLDARLEACLPILSEARLIGRVSTAHDTEVRLLPASEDVAELPADLRVGDILAIPCVGADLRPAVSIP